MENSNLLLQQKFSFFAVGDSCTASVFSVSENKVNLRSKGGIIAAISMEKYSFYVNWGLKLQIGKTITGSVDEIIEGIPYIVLDIVQIINSHLQPAVVLLAGPRSVLLSMNGDKDAIAIYQPQEGSLIELDLAEKDKVFCSDITLENGDYIVKKLSLSNEPAIKKEPILLRTKPVAPALVKVEVEEIPNPNNFDKPEPWSKANLDKAFAAGSLNRSNDFVLGNCYVGKLVENSFLVSLSETQKAKVINRNSFPDLNAGDSVVVRILKIYNAGFICMDCKIIPNSPDYIEWFEKVQFQLKAVTPQKQPKIKSEAKDSVVTKNGFTFGVRDNDVYTEGRDAGSQDSFEQYWLGFLLEVPVVDGKPYFVNRAGVNIDVNLIDSDVVFKTGETVYARLCYINVKNKEVKFTVQVLYVEEEH